MRRRTVPMLVAAGLCAAAAVHAQLPEPLQALATTERAFAAAAKAMGQRDAFLEFFADEAVVFAPGPVEAKPRLRQRPSVPFADRQLTWEPRVGDVAASGDLGWLSGPAAMFLPTEKEPGPYHENYLSVWRRQPTGEWKVILDVGAGTPREVPFEPGFNRLTVPSRFAGAVDAAHPDGLADADRAFNADAGSRSQAAAYGDRLLATSRLHRDDMMPLVGRDAIVPWLEANPAAYTGQTLHADAAKSGDLGFTYGSYTLTGGRAERGTYARVWSRDAAGVWRIVVDVTRPAEP